MGKTLMEETKMGVLEIFSDKMNLETRKRDQEEQGEKPKRNGYFKRTGNR